MHYLTIQGIFCQALCYNIELQIQTQKNTNIVHISWMDHQTIFGVVIYIFIIYIKGLALGLRALLNGPTATLAMFERMSFAL